MPPFRSFLVYSPAYLEVLGRARYFCSSAHLFYCFEGRQEADAATLPRALNNCRATRMDSLPVGSAAWIGGEAYFDSEEYSDRINQFIDKIDEGALVTFASGLRENRSCNISREFSVGSFHLVRKIQFDDGVEWIARLRMPPMPDEDGEIDTRESTLLGMQSELATMEFLR